MNDQQNSSQQPAGEELDLSVEARSESLQEDQGPPVIMIDGGVVAGAAEHGQQDTSREQAGVLVGRVADGRQGPVVCVEAAIPAAHTQASRSRVTFTHDTWSDIYRVIDSQYADKQIVGWYHTHPGFGIFLSEYDLFIQRNFFSAPWQIAYVVDPLSREAGCFCWQGGDVTQTDGYNIYSAAGSQLPVPPPASVPSHVPATAAAQPRRLNVAMLALLGVILVLQLANMLAGVRAARRTQTSPDVASPAAVQTQLPQQELAEQWATLEDVQKELEELRTSLSRDYEWYRVKPGDGLWRIAQQAYGRGDMAGLIAAENGLDAAAPELEPGMMLRLPRVPQKADESAESTE